MTLGDLINNVNVQGKVHLVVFKDGEEVEKKTIGWTDGLCWYDEYRTNGVEIHVSDYEDLEVTYIYTNGDGLTIEMNASE